MRLRPLLARALVAAAGVALLSCASQVDSVKPDPVRPPETPAPRQALESQTGLATFYGAALHGEQTASGEAFNNSDLVAAHPSYPLGTVVRVTNLRNGRAVEVRINDRGPANKRRNKAIVIDLSRGAAEALDCIKDGKVRVRVEVLRWGGARPD